MPAQIQPGTNIGALPPLPAFRFATAVTLDLALQELLADTGRTGGYYLSKDLNLLQ